jgi:NADPH-dependent curcumin reductase CurA
MPGLTAYYGLHDIGRPEKGQTIFVSGASGAVGQMVIALAHRLGLKVRGHLLYEGASMTLINQDIIG